MKECTIHLTPPCLVSSLILAEAMQSAGIRAFIGKLSMDTSSRPTYVEASTEASLSSAKSFVDRCRHIMAQMPPHQRRIEPVLTPRFVPTCSDELLGGLGDLSRLESLRVQSHLAEAHDQVEWVRSERGAEDIDIFDRVRSHLCSRQPDDLTLSSEQSPNPSYGSSPLHLPHKTGLVKDGLCGFIHRSLPIIQRLLLNRTISAS